MKVTIVKTGLANIQVKAALERLGAECEVSDRLTKSAVPIDWSCTALGHLVQACLSLTHTD